MVVTRWGVPTTPSEDRHGEVIDKEAEMSEFPAKILIATDGSEDAKLAARAAISLAHDTDAELHVVHVGPAHVYPLAPPVPPCPRGPQRSSGKKPRRCWTGRWTR